MLISMLNFYDCKVCETPCIGMVFDGEIFEKEVCSPECLAQLAVRPTPRALDEKLAWLCDCGRKHFDVYDGFTCLCGIVFRQ